MSWWEIYFYIWDNLNFYWHFYGDVGNAGLHPTRGGNCCLSTWTINFWELQKWWGWGRWGHSEERSQNHCQKRYVSTLDYQIQESWYTYFFFLQEKIIWISILFPVPLLSLLLFPTSRWKQFALILFTNIFKFHHCVLILSKSEIIWLGLGLSLSWDNEQSICLTN